jgi:hypothetical protein
MMGLFVWTPVSSVVTDEDEDDGEEDLGVSAASVATLLLSGALGSIWMCICKSRMESGIFFLLYIYPMFLGDSSYRRPHLVPIEFFKMYHPPTTPRFRVTWHLLLIGGLILLILRSLAMAKIETVTGIERRYHHKDNSNKNQDEDVGPRSAVSTRDRGEKPVPRVRRQM